MSLYDRLNTLITAGWNTAIITPKPMIYNLALANDVMAVYEIGIKEGQAPMPPVSIGTTPTHERKWDFQLQLGTRSSEADLEKMVEETCRIVEGTALTDGIYIIDLVGAKQERHGMKVLDIFGYEHQLIVPGTAF